MEKYKKIFIAGAGSAAWWNAGDEAIFSSMLSDLRSEIPDAQFFVLSANPPGTLQSYRVEEIPFNNIGLMVKAVKESDLLILGGGGLFYDYWGFNVDDLLTPDHVGQGVYVDFAILATLLNKPLMIYAVGVGPLNSETGQSYTKIIFEQAQQITVRDPASKELMASLGIPAEKIQTTADPVYGARQVSANAGQQYLQEKVGPSLQAPILGVSLRAWNLNDSPESDWGPSVAQALDHFIEQYGGTVLFIPFHKKVDQVDDASESERVQHLMKHADRAFVAEESYSPDEKVSILRCCDLVLGMRLHSLIFAIRYGIPVVGLAYDPKVSQVLLALHREEYLLDLSGLDEDVLYSALQSAYENRADLSAYYRNQASLLEDLAHQNAKLAAELLRRERSTTAPLSEKTEQFIKSLLLEQSLHAYRQYNRIRNLLDQVSQLQQTIDSKTQALEDMNQVLEDMNQALEFKNQSLEHTLQVLEDTKLILNNTNQALYNNFQALNQIHSSRSWRFITRLGNIRLRIAPHGSRREKILFSVLSLLSLLKTRVRRPYQRSEEEDRPKTGPIESNQPASEPSGSSIPPSSIQITSDVPDSSTQSSSNISTQATESENPSQSPSSNHELIRAPHKTKNTGRVILAVSTFFDFEGNNMFFGGAERYLMELVRLVRSLGYEVEVYQCATSDWVRYYKDVRVVGINCQGDVGLFNVEFHKSIEEGILTVYFVFFLAQPLYFSSSSIGISHGVYWDNNRFEVSSSEREKWTKEILEAFSHISTMVSVDTNTINWVRATNRSLGERFIYIPNFVDLEQFHPKDPGQKSGDEKIIVLYPRRLYGPRGFWLVQKLIPEFLKKYPNLIFHFVGKADPQEEQAVRTLVAEYPGQVEWYFLPPERMHEAYERADIALIPTISSEGTSLSCLEAMASGNAVIATNIGGLPDLILSNYNGILIEPNLDSLRDALHLLLRDPSLRVSLAKRGMEVAKSFDIEHWRAQWKKVLERYLPKKEAFAKLPTIAVFPPAPAMKWEGDQQRSHFMALQLATHGIETYWQNPGGRQSSDYSCLHVITEQDDLYLERPILFLSHPQQVELLKQYDHPFVVYDVPSSDLQAMDEHKKLLNQADIVLAASQELLQQIRSDRADAVYLPLGADEETTEAFVMQAFLTQLHEKRK